MQNPYAPFPKFIVRFFIPWSLVANLFLRGMEEDKHVIFYYFDLIQSSKICWRNGEIAHCMTYNTMTLISTTVLLAQLLTEPR